MRGGVDVERIEQRLAARAHRLGILRQPRAQDVGAHAAAGLCALDRRQHRESERFVGAAIEGWQPTRQLIERLTATRDWAEQWFVLSAVVEPLLGELFRSGFVMQVAALHGDFVTPTIFGAGESDAARDQRGARALFSMLTGDAAHGAENVGTLNGWLAAWTGDALAAARQLQPIWSQLSEKVVRFEDSLERSEQRMASLLGDIGLETPKEVTA